MLTAEQFDVIQRSVLLNTSPFEAFLGQRVVKRALSGWTCKTFTSAFFWRLVRRAKSRGLLPGGKEDVRRTMKQGGRIFAIVGGDGAGIT